MNHVLRNIASISIVLSVCFTFGCADQAKRATPRISSRNVEILIHQRLLKIAGEYKSYGRPNSQVKWAPGLCRAPAPSEATPKIQFSKSDSSKTHGQKLYFLYARDAKAYKAVATQASPANQVLVKESFKAIEAPFDQGVATINLPLAQRDGKYYHAGKKNGLFIMFKVELYVPASKTDNGWLYGTVSADGKTVTSSGRIASCMKCHAEAPHDRLFGLVESGP
jgi:hypothetical protein